MGKEDELWRAVQGGDAACLRRLLLKHPEAKSRKKGTTKQSNVNLQDDDGMSLLHHACLSGSAGVVTALLDGHCTVDISDSKGLRPLHYAAWQGSADTVQALLKAGASANLPSHEQRTPLHLASQHGHHHAAEVLLQHRADPCVRDAAGKTALSLACEFGRLQVVRLLLGSHVSPRLLEGAPSEQGDGTVGNSPIHLAAKNGHADITRMLILEGVDLNSQTNIGTPLHEAALHGKLDIVKLLLQSGAEAAAENKFKQTALDLVMQFTGRQASKEIKHALREAMHTVQACAVTDYCNAYDSTCLRITAGDIITVLERQESGLWKGYVRDRLGASRVGYFPSSVVQIISSSADPTSSIARPVSLPFSKDRDSGGLFTHADTLDFHKAQTVCGGSRDLVWGYNTGDATVGDCSSVGSSRSSGSGESVGSRRGQQDHHHHQQQQHRQQQQHHHQQHYQHQQLNTIAKITHGEERIIQTGNLPSAVRDASSSAKHLNEADQAVYKWLTGFDLQQYTPCFTSAGYDLFTMSHMTPQDVAAVGITKPGHRKIVGLEISRLAVADELPTTKPATLREWLSQIGLGHYHAILADNGYDKVDFISEITLEDLQEIGITKLGHQKRLLLAGKRLKALQKREAAQAQSTPRLPGGTAALFSSGPGSDSGLSNASDFADEGSPAPFHQLGRRGSRQQQQQTAAAAFVFPPMRPAAPPPATPTPPLTPPLPVPLLRPLTPPLTSPLTPPLTPPLPVPLLRPLPPPLPRSRSRSPRTFSGRCRRSEGNVPPPPAAATAAAVPLPPKFPPEARLRPDSPPEQSGAGAGGFGGFARSASLRSRASAASPPPPADGGLARSNSFATRQKRKGPPPPPPKRSASVSGGGYSSGGSSSGIGGSSSSSIASSNSGRSVGGGEASSRSDGGGDGDAPANVRRLAALLERSTFAASLGGAALVAPDRQPQPQPQLQPQQPQQQQPQLWRQQSQKRPSELAVNNPSATAVNPTGRTASPNVSVVYPNGRMVVSPGDGSAVTPGDCGRTLGVAKRRPSVSEEAGAALDGLPGPARAGGSGVDDRATSSRSPSAARSHGATGGVPTQVIRWNGGRDGTGSLSAAEPLPSPPPGQSKREVPLAGPEKIVAKSGPGFLRPPVDRRAAVVAFGGGGGGRSVAPPAPRLSGAESGAPTSRVEDRWSGRSSERSALRRPAAGQEAAGQAFPFGGAGDVAGADERSGTRARPSVKRQASLRPSDAGELNPCRGLPPPPPASAKPQRGNGGGAVAARTYMGFPLAPGCVGPEAESPSGKVVRYDAEEQQQQKTPADILDDIGCMFDDLASQLNSMLE
uniref:Caskin-1-like n=1 Tax=Petromyzon marinus TaxID=7757 RepID=A0AAJ7UC51_PETMA|nr:caskin-1-like [Petromyzon marinus]